MQPLQTQNKTVLYLLHYANSANPWTATISGPLYPEASSWVPQIKLDVL